MRYLRLITTLILPNLVGAIGVSPMYLILCIVDKFKLICLNELMRLKYYSVKKLKKEILNIIRKYLDLKLYKVFFFGSRVTGKYIEGSDIDIGIEGPNPVPLSILEKIEGDLENLPTLYKFEIVDFKRVAPDFKKVALKNIELIAAHVKTR